MAQDTSPRIARRRWSERVPPSIKALMDWARWLARPALALLALYTCLFVLQIVGLAPGLLPSRRPDVFPIPTLSLALQPEDLFSDYDWTVTGHTQPGVVVEIGANQRLLETTWPDTDGGFSARIATTLQVNQIWARALDPITGEVVAQESIPLEWGSQVAYRPALEVAIYVEDAGWLWVAGWAAPYASLSVETDDGPIAAAVTADEFGIFDNFVRLDGGRPPQWLRVRAAGQVQAVASDAVAVTSLPLAELPLARVADVDFQADRPLLHLRVELPSAHPYFSALAQGYLSAEQFSTASFGWLAEAWGMAYTPTLTTQAGTAVVELDGQWPGPITEFRLTPYSQSSIASAPLLTAKDRVSLHFDDRVRPAWFDYPLPGEMQPDIVSWRGPILEGGPRHIIRMGLDLPPELAAQRWLPPGLQLSITSEQQRQRAEEEKRRAEEKMREFLADIEARATGGFISQTWRALILLIPYASLLWLARPAGALARRGRFGQPQAWKPVVALVLILAVWRSWNYFYFLLLSGPVAWLQRLVTPVRYALGMGGDEAQSRFLAGVGQNAFWLLFVCGLALVPFYLPVVEASLGWRPTRAPARPSFLRRIGAGIRAVYGLLALALLVLTTQFDALARMAWFEAARERVSYSLEQTWWLDRDIASFIMSILQYGPTRSLLQVALLALLLLVFGLRTAGCGVGLLAVVLRAFVVVPSMTMPASLRPAADLIAQIPWPAVLIFCGLMAYPLVLHLLRRLTPALPGTSPGWPLRRLALALIAVSITLAYWPPYWALAVGGVLVFCAISWLVITGLREFEPFTSLAAWAARWPWAFFPALALLAWVIAQPIPGPARELEFGHLFNLMAELDGVFIYILVLALVLLMHGYTRQRNRPRIVLDPSLLEEVALVLFAVFLVNSSRRWLFVPVPFLVGLLMARFWLFRPVAGIKALGAALGQAAQRRRELIEDMLEAASAKTRFENIRKALGKKLEAAELDAGEYQHKLESYRQHFGQELDLEEVKPGYKSQDVVFAVGETDLWKNTQIAVKYGAVLATVPLLIALYDYLPASLVRYPYPVANLLTFLIQSAASWLLYAFFFGYYYVHLRGNSGLAKGICLFLGLATPFAVYNLLSTQSLEEMRPFLLWLTQIFLFCTLLGLLCVDYRLLRQNGFKLRDLLAVHNLPVLSVYASSVVAAVIPAVVAISTDRLSDLATFFLNTVLPRVPAGGP